MVRSEREPTSGNTSMRRGLSACGPPRSSRRFRIPRVCSGFSRRRLRAGGRGCAKCGLFRSLLAEKCRSAVFICLVPRELNPFAAFVFTKPQFRKARAKSNREKRDTVYRTSRDLCQRTAKTTAHRPICSSFRAPGPGAHAAFRFRGGLRLSRDLPRNRGAKLSSGGEGRIRFWGNKNPPPKRRVASACWYLFVRGRSTPGAGSGRVRRLASGGSRPAS